MELLPIQSRRLRLTFSQYCGSRIASRSLILLLLGCGLNTFAIAQVSSTSVPDAPKPNVPSLTATIAENSAPQSSNLDGTVVSNTNGDVSLYTVVDLALRNSKSVLVAEAEQQRVRSIWLETRDVYIPNFSIGSGLGYSYGFPLGNPTLFNINSNNFLLFSFSQRDYIRSSQAAVKAATLSLKNTRQQVILDATLNYFELNKTLDQIAALHEAIDDMGKLISVMQDRQRAGLETNIQMTQAQLNHAQIQLRLIQMEDHADEIRKHLSGLTSLNPDTIVPVSSSIPDLPDLDFQVVSQKGANAPNVQAAAAQADAKMYAAWGDKRQNYRPTVYGEFQYARFSSFNGYSNYYLHFTPNNIGVGIQASLPLFDAVRRNKAQESAAEAVRDRRQAELTKIQNDENNFALWHSLRELEAQEKVAVLQQQLASDMLAATETQLKSNSTAANGAPVTPQQAEQSRVDERTTYVDMRDAQFNVTKVKLNLLNAVGELEDWAKGSGQLQPDSTGNFNSNGHP